MGDLATDTTVTGGDGRYRATLSRDWEIWGPNGGYVASIALRAAGAHSRFDRPASIVGHFLGVASFDAPVEIETTTLRAAKRAESVRVSMRQGDAPIFEALVWAVGAVDGLEHDATAMPEVPPPESLPSIAELTADDGETGYPFWQNFDERVTSWMTRDEWERRPPGDPVFAHWYRFVPTPTFADPWVDACRLLILVDTLGWPAACGRHVRNDYMAPSIDLSCAFHRPPTGEEWLYAQGVSPSAAHGLVGCESRVWSRSGALLAHGASQLLCRPAPAR